MSEIIKFIINTLVLSVGMILLMFVVFLLVFGLGDIRIKLMNIFYNTKIGSIFKKYHIFETVFIGLFFLILLSGCFEIGRRMIGVYF